MNEKTKNGKQTALSAGKKDLNKTGKVGGQFNNKNAEKWTEEEALKLADDILFWILPKYKEKEGKNYDFHFKNIFYRKYLALHNYDDDIIAYLCNKFKSFSEVIKRCKMLQEHKLIELGLSKTANPAMAIFCLKNHHDYKEKSAMDLSGQVSDIPQAQINVINTQVKK